MKYIVFFYIFISSFAYGEIKVKCSPVLFKEVRAQNNGVYKSKAVARGIIEIYSDNLEEDLGKLVTFQSPSHTYITNNKRFVKIDKIKFKKNDSEVIITEENTKIIFHVVLDKKELSKEKNTDLIDGIYTGILSMNYSIYDKEI